MTPWASPIVTPLGWRVQLCPSDPVLILNYDLFPSSVQIFIFLLFYWLANYHSSTCEYYNESWETHSSIMSTKSILQVLCGTDQLLSEGFTLFLFSQPELTATETDCCRCGQNVWMKKYSIITHHLDSLKAKNQKKKWKSNSKYEKIEILWVTQRSEENKNLMVWVVKSQSTKCQHQPLGLIVMGWCTELLYSE